MLLFLFLVLQLMQDVFLFSRLHSTPLNGISSLSAFLLSALLLVLSGWLHPGSRLCAPHHDIEGAVLRDVDGVYTFPC